MRYVILILLIAYIIFCAYIYYAYIRPIRDIHNINPVFIVGLAGWITIILSILIRYIWGWIKMKLESLKNVEKRCKYMIDEMIELIDKAGEDNETD